MLSSRLVGLSAGEISEGQLHRQSNWLLTHLRPATKPAFTVAAGAAGASASS